MFACAFISCAVWLVPGDVRASDASRVAALIERIVVGKHLDSSIEELGKLDWAAPYIRMVPDPAPQQRDYRRDLKKALAPIENRIRDRNFARCKIWGERGRLDLCAEFLATIQDEETASKIANLTLPIRDRVFEHWSDRNMVQYPFGPRFTDKMPPLALIDDVVQVQVPAGFGRGVMVVARKCVAKDFLKFNWFVVAGSSLNESLPQGSGNGVWEGCFLMVNSDASFTRLRSCFVVCDGDVELSPGVESCVVIANGNITSKMGGGGDLSLLGATGDIRLPLRKKTGTNIFHAGGKVVFDGTLIPPSPDVKERQRDLPFGIRFFQHEEFGLEIAVQDGALQFSKVGEESPFAKFGVEDADVITKIDEVVPKSLPDFRRALRRGVIRESVILHIKRDKKDITRIVFLDGIPVPLAPPPRPK